MLKLSDSLTVTCTLILLFHVGKSTYQTYQFVQLCSLLFSNNFCPYPKQHNYLNLL